MGYLVIKIKIIKNYLNKNTHTVIDNDVCFLNK